VKAAAVRFVEKITVNWMNGMNRYIEAEFRDRLSAAKERAEKAEAQVQAVCDWASRDYTPAVAGDWMAGYSSARRDIRIILDGPDE